MAWDLRRGGQPWGRERPSIFDFLSARLQSDGSLGPHAPDLPDKVRDPARISFSPGSEDGIARHFGLREAQEPVVQSIVDAIATLSRRSSGRNAKRLYEQLTDADVLPVIDDVINQIVVRQLDPSRVREIGRWLARSAPDRSAVKFGMALLGMVEPADPDTMLTLGAHDDFTLYAVVGLRNSAAGERVVFDLARRVHGWGRIEVVERLADTNDPEIRGWLLREGYQNAVMYEYLAMICARTGRLADALVVDEIDDGLLAAAGEILEAIANGNPGPSINEYEDASVAIEHYFRHLNSRRGTLNERRIVTAIRGVLREPQQLELSEADRDRMLDLAEQFCNREHFGDQVEPGLRSSDNQTYWNAKQAARDFGVDIYDAVVERIERSLDDSPVWFDLMQATTPDRLARSLELGRRRIDVASIATGPSTAIGMGPEFSAHMEVGWFLQELRRHPGQGWDFVSAGLRSPSIQNRNDSVQALRAWPRGTWPSDASAALEAMISAEVDPRTKSFASDVLAGDVALDEAWRRTLDRLAERGIELVPVARRLSLTPVGLRVRSEGGFGNFVLWNGPYDTQPYEQLHLTVGRDQEGFNVTLSEGLGEPLERHTALDRDQCEERSLDLMRRLLP